MKLFTAGQQVKHDNKLWYITGFKERDGKTIYCLKRGHQAVFGRGGVVVNDESRCNTLCRLPKGQMHEKLLSSTAGNLPKRNRSHRQYSRQYRTIGGGAMSLMIKGMSLPKHAAVNGEKDTAYKCLILAHPDNSVELVIDIKFASAYDNGHNIQRYPIAEVPTPHGRLIDADALRKTIESIYGVALWTFDCFECIRKAPTVIEAEVRE